MSLVSRARAEPVWWMRFVLGAKLWAIQSKIAESVVKNRRTAVRACHGAGKSFVAARIALWFLYAYPGSIVVTTAPTFRQVKLILWQEIARAFNGAIAPLGGNLTETKLQVGDQWYGYGFSASEYDESRVQGLHAPSGRILVIVDEAGGIGKQIMTGIEGLLSSPGARLLTIGNPTDPSGPFADEFKDPMVAKFAISVYDTPNFTAFGIDRESIKDGTWRAKVGDYPMPYPYLVTPEWVYERSRRWGIDSPLYKARVEATFPEDSDDALIPLSKIEAARRRSLPILPTYRPIGGLDVALRGEAESVLVRRVGPIARVMKRWHGKPTENTPFEVAQAVKEGQYDSLRIDSIGVGAFVPMFVKLLAGADFGVTGINVSLPASDSERFVNVKAEAYWEIKMAAETDNLDLPEFGDDAEELAAQLSSIRTMPPDGRGRIRIEPKDLAAKRGVPSPDLAEALMLTYCGGGIEEWRPSDARIIGESAINRRDSPFQNQDD